MKGSSGADTARTASDRAAARARPGAAGMPGRSPRRAAPGHRAGLTEHIQALRRYANVLVGSHADADDLVQEALKRALIYLDGNRRIDNLRAYLFTILHNVRNDALRKQARSGAQVPVEDAGLISNAALQPDRIACSEVLQAIQRLSEEHRQVLLLAGVEGMSYRETAAILDLPIGTVMSRLSRARTALREALDLEASMEFERPF